MFYTATAHLEEVGFDDARGAFGGCAHRSDDVSHNVSRSSQRRGISCGAPKGMPRLFRRRFEDILPRQRLVAVGARRAREKGKRLARPIRERCDRFIHEGADFWRLIGRLC